MKRTIRSVAFDANGVIYYRNAEVSASVVDFIQAKGIVLPTDAESMYVKLMNEAFSSAMSREEMVEGSPVVGGSQIPLSGDWLLLALPHTAVRFISTPACQKRSNAYEN